LAFLTLFSAPKPFTDPKISAIQRNAIRSWVELGRDVEVILIGDEEGISSTVREFGVQHLKDVKKNSSGTPLVSSIFQNAREASHSPLLACVNADILLLPNFVTTAQKIVELHQRFLVVGQRWDLDINEELDFSSGWQSRLVHDCELHGDLHKPTGSDYFIFPRECFRSVPDFAVGRAGWDNWMIFESRLKGWKTIDATGEIQVIHQSHDYSHLPNGQAHYHLPETNENVRLAGGRRTIFTLTDANWVFVKGNISRKKPNLKRIVREIEIFPLIRVRSKGLTAIFYRGFQETTIREPARSKLCDRDKIQPRRSAR
jgi:hypothetical protein